MDTLELLLTICQRRQAEKFLRILRKHEIHLTQSALARGTATSEVLDLLSLQRSQKALLLAVASSATLPALMRDFRRDLYIDIPGNGIVLTLPMRSIAGQRSLALLTHRQSYQRPNGSEESTMAPTAHELLIVIADEGHTDTIMDAARSAGAGGGTILHAKGTGAAYAKQFFGLTLAGEKELLLIVTPTARREAIMKAVIQAAGPSTRAHGIVFSLPVSSVAGLRAEED